MSNYKYGDSTNFALHFLLIISGIGILFWLFDRMTDDGTLGGVPKNVLAANQRAYKRSKQVSDIQKTLYSDAQYSSWAEAGAEAEKRVQKIERAKDKIEEPWSTIWMTMFAALAVAITVAGFTVT